MNNLIDSEYIQFFLILIPVFLLLIYLVFSEIRDILTDVRHGIFIIRNLMEEKEMVETYATLIVNGKKTLNQVPTRIREQVKQCLVDLGVEFLIEE